MGRGECELTKHARAQDRERGVLSEWDRIGQAASTDKTRRFTTLLHHVYNIETLREAYFSLKRDAAPGVDEQTWQTYGEHLDTQLEDLSLRLRRGAYRAKPVRTRSPCSTMFAPASSSGPTRAVTGSSRPGKRATPRR